MEGMCNFLSIFLRESTHREHAPPMWSLEGALFPILKASSLLYSGAYHFRLWLYRVQVCKKESLPLPVISVGNISWGGNGKTPMVDYLARRMLSVGLRPVVLVRVRPTA
jgi:tetraacyldisaccharide 4'-kinase